MAVDPKVQQLVTRWRSGDAQAAEELHRRYWQQLYELIEQQLDQRLQSRIAPEDVLQSAFRSFFGRAGAGQYCIDDSNQLWKLLKTITLNKLRKQVERHRAAKRDPRCEYSLDDDLHDWDIISREPAPEDAVVFLDEFDALTASLSDREQQIVQLCLQGESMRQIALQVGCSRWTVRRTLGRVVERLRRRAEELK